MNKIPILWDNRVHWLTGDEFKNLVLKDCGNLKLKFKKVSDSTPNLLRLESVKRVSKKDDRACEGLDKAGKSEGDGSPADRSG